MQFQESITINTNTSEVFKLYQDVQNWSSWDSDVEFSEIFGDFKTDAIGELKPKGAPKSKIFFIEVTENKSFTTLGKLPLCKMYFEHTLDKIDDNTTEVTHKISFEGLLSPLFGRVIGNGIKNNLPNVLKGLKDKAEANKTLE